MDIPDRLVQLAQASQEPPVDGYNCAELYLSDSSKTKTQSTKDTNSSSRNVSFEGSDRTKRARETSPVRQPTKQAKHSPSSSPKHEVEDEDDVEVIGTRLSKKVLKQVWLLCFIDTFRWVNM